MSLIATIEGDLKTAFQKIESWWGKEPDFATLLGTGVNIAGVALEAVFTVENNGPAATLVGNIVSGIQQKLAAATQLVQAVGPTPSVKSLLAGVSTDITELESAAGVKDPKSTAAITLAAKTINGLVNSFPVASTAPIPAATGS